MTRAIAVTLRAPKRFAVTPAVAELAVHISNAGMRNSPAASAENPSTNCTYWVLRNNSPPSVNCTRNTVSVGMRKVRRFTIAGSNKGSSTRRSHQTSAMLDRTPTTRATHTQTSGDEAALTAA